MAGERAKKTSAVSSIIAILFVAIAMMVVAVVRVRSFFRPKYVPIEQVQFPVLVIQPDGVPVFAEWDASRLSRFPEKSQRTPVNGTVLIDSAFNQFKQENVSRKTEGELKQIARFLIPGLDVKYTFDLRRSPAKGREAAMELIRLAPPFSESADQDAAMRPTRCSKRPWLDC